MAMSAAQEAAYNAAMGGATVTTTQTLFASILGVIVFMFAAWLMYRSINAMARSRATAMDMVFVGLRASFLIAIVILLIQP